MGRCTNTPPDPTVLMCGRHVVGEMGTREPVKRVIDVWVDHAIHALVRRKAANAMRAMICVGFIKMHVMNPDE